MDQEQVNRAKEQQRVDWVVDVINEKENSLIEQGSKLKDTVVTLRKTFWDDVTVNLDEPDDVIETEASIKQQAELLGEKERFHGLIGEELRTLQRLKRAPYFGRIDFKEETEQQSEPIYIGIASLMDQEEENFLIYDWRAPISSLYYDYALGKASYQTRTGEIHGEITLKRQFLMRQGKITGMFDTGVTIVDQLLQEALGNNASSTMRNIVATIQREQNKIIRNERSKLLIVQGVAGSGKTSAALQRIAYLMYRYRGDLTADNVMLLSPNPLFTSYIRNVLPELGETNVKQMTLQTYLEQRIGEKITVESPFDQIEYTLTNEADRDYEVRMESITYKSSLAFKQLIDTYLAYLLNEGLQFKTITLRGKHLITKQEITSYFYSLDEKITLPNKIEAVTKWLLKELWRCQKAEISSDWVSDQIELLDKEDYLAAYDQVEQYDTSAEIDEEMILRKMVVGKAFASIRKRVKRLEFVNILATYRRMFTHWTVTEKPTSWQAIANYSAECLAQKLLMWEEAAPYYYFKVQILGQNDDRGIRHLFIDEAQDYSACQFAIIKQLFPYTKMTLLGDINQAVYGKATENNPLMIGMEKTDHERITLTKSYRSTKEIVDFTTYFAPEKDMIVPFDRHGRKPQLIKLSNREALNTAIIDSVKTVAGHGCETIAIITKTLSEAEQIYEALKNRISIIHINEEKHSFSKGLLVLPVYLAKGIEFDAVIIPDASDEHYQTKDQGLFYTACTRAMHELIILSTPNVCSFLLDIQNEAIEGKVFDNY